MHENVQLITDHVSPDIFQIFNIKLKTYEEQKIFSMLIISIEGCDSNPYNHPNMSLGLLHLPTKI